MPTAETASGGTGLGRWPKVVLWTLVLLFGLLYLGSVRRDPGGSASALGDGGGVAVFPGQSAALRGPGAEGPTATTDLPEVVAPARLGGGVSAPGPGSKEGAEPLPEPAPSPPVAEDSEPTRAAESAAFADSLLGTESPQGPNQGPRPDVQ